MRSHDVLGQAWVNFIYDLHPMAESCFSLGRQFQQRRAKSSGEVEIVATVVQLCPVLVAPSQRLR